MTNTAKHEHSRGVTARSDAEVAATGRRRCGAERSWTAGLITVALASCGHADGPRTDEVVPIVAPGGNGGTISALTLDGVWVFRMSGAWGQEAILSGEVGIDGDCLVVGEHVVIWPTGRGSRVVEVLAAARSGRSRLVQLPGGESSNVPEVVAEHCAVEHVWRVNALEAAR